MEFDTRRPTRKSRRLKGYDYSRSGGYFVTLCAQDRREFFGEVREGAMRPNDAGEMIARWWAELAAKFPDVTLDEHQVMPNHFHGIVFLWPDDEGGPQDVRAGAPPHRPALPEIVRWFKTMTTNEYARRVRADGWPRFGRHLWQRDYHDHVIRSNDDLNNVRRYIRDNPREWSTDKENPFALKIDPRWGGGTAARRIRRSRT